MSLLGFAIGAVAGYIIMCSISDDDDDWPSMNAANKAADQFVSRFSPSPAV